MVRCVRANVPLRSGTEGFGPPWRHRDPSTRMVRSGWSLGCPGFGIFCVDPWRRLGSRGRCFHDDSAPVTRSGSAKVNVC